MTAADILILFSLLYPVAAAVQGVIGCFFGRKEYPDARPRRFAVIICARNEEKVIGSLLESLNSQEYPKEMVTCFVVAHNCTDRTADIARGFGAVVFELNDADKNTKGDALSYGIGRINELYPDTFDAMCFFDADNLAGHCFLKEVNAALSTGADAVTGFRHSKNYHQSVVSELFGSYWYQIMYTQNIPHTAMGMTPVVGGTGFAVTMENLRDGWKTETLLEDVEFTAQMILLGKKIITAPKALFYDEQPSELKAGLRQRYRWAVGGYQLLRRYLPRLIMALPVHGKQVLGFLPAILINPVMLLTLTGFFVRVAESFKNGGIKGLLIYVLAVMLAAWIFTLPITLMLYGRQKMSILKYPAALLLFPVFLMISLPLSVAALFERKPEWKPVPHESSTRISDIEKQDHRPQDP